MATITVSGTAQLNSAIRNAGSGDTILLEGGRYGTLHLSGMSKNLRIASKNPAGDAAEFGGIELRNCANLTFDGLELKGVVRGGYGTGDGFHVLDCRNVTLQDSRVVDLWKGVVGVRSTGLEILNNTFDRNSEDAMAFGDVHQTRIVGNRVIGMKAPPNGDSNGLHNDLIHIDSPPGGGVSSDVVIQGNYLVSNDTFTHGIYLGNSSSGETFRNIVIDNNTVVGGHHLGLSVARVQGLMVRNNVVLQDTDVDSGRSLYVPKIIVDRGSSNVTITGNTAHAVLAGSGGDWTMWGNKIVPLGTRPPSSAPRPGPDDPNGGPDLPPADLFVFDGEDVNGWVKSRIDGLDFGEGDAIRLTGYESGTFRGATSSNGGTAAMIHSEAELRALIDASPDVTAVAWRGGDTLALRIEQDDGMHAIRITGLDDPMSFM